MSKGNQYVDPPEGYTGNYKFMNYRGTRVKVGIGQTPFLLNIITRKLHNEESIVIVITGPPGIGKTYFALRIAEMVDKKFNPDIQVVYEQKQLLKIISDDSPIHKGQAVIIDEAQFSVGGRNWHEQLQKDLMEQLQAVRSKGLVLILVVLGIDILDLTLRKYILGLRIHMEKRGTGTVYKSTTDRFTGAHWEQPIGKAHLKVPGWKTCKQDKSCLSCRESGIRKTQWRNREKWDEEGFTPCMSLRAVYERRKKNYVEEHSKESLAVAEVKEIKAKPINMKQLTQDCFNKQNPLKLNNRGAWNKDEVRVYLSTIHPELRIGLDLARGIIKQAELDKPEFFKKTE